MDTPTAELVRGWTPETVDWDALGYTDDDPDPLAQPVRSAVSWFYLTTGLTFASIPDELAGVVENLMPALTYTEIQKFSAERLETMDDFDLVASFSAGRYSETRRSPEEAMKARLLHPWPWVSALLWQLLTPEKRDYWDDYYGGSDTPAFEVTEVSWGAGRDSLGDAAPDWLGRAEDRSGGF